MFTQLLIAVCVLSAAMAANDGGRHLEEQYDLTNIDQNYLRNSHALETRRRRLAVTGSPWREQNKLLAFDGAEGDSFGGSVSISADTVVIGSLGSVYVFVRDDSLGWIQGAKLVAEDNDKSFGGSVSISSDTIVVGRHLDDAKGVGSGSVYVFVREGSTWTQQAKLLAEDEAENDHFGISVDISGDTIVVGSEWDDDKGVNSGSVYVFVRQGTTWTQQAKLLAEDGEAYDSFGESVSISSDTIVVGSHLDDDKGIDSGSAYVFVRVGASWTQQAKLVALDGAMADLFGFSVDVSSDTIVVGSHQSDALDINSGCAYVFVRDGTTWTQQAKLAPEVGGSYESFGWSVSIQNDKIVVGSIHDDVSAFSSGSAYVFVRHGTMWVEEAKIAARDGGIKDFFGWSVSIFDDTVVVGSNLDDDEGKDSGSAYIFSTASSTPPVEEISPSCVASACSGFLSTFSGYSMYKTGTLGQCRERCVNERLIDFSERLGWVCGNCQDSNNAL